MRSLIIASFFFRSFRVQTRGVSGNSLEELKSYFLGEGMDPSFGLGDFLQLGRGEVSLQVSGNELGRTSTFQTCSSFWGSDVGEFSEDLVLEGFHFMDPRVHILDGEGHTLETIPSLGEMERG